MIASLYVRRHGTTRTVWLIGRWAIKVPSCCKWRLFLHGLLANLQERSFSATRWAKLCPVLWSTPGGWLLVMRRARPLTRAEWDAFDPEPWCQEEDYVIPAEHKMDSFGVLDGRIVAVDYGN